MQLVHAVAKRKHKNSGSKGSNPDLCDPPDTGAALFGFLYAVATFTARIFLKPMADGSLDKSPKSFVLNCFFFFCSVR